MVFKLRCAIFDHVQRLSLTFHDSTTVGDSLYRIAWDAYSVQTIFNQGVVPTLTAIVTLTGIVAVMFTRDWSLTLAALSVAVPLLVIICRFERRMAARAAQVCQRESDVTFVVRSLVRPGRKALPPPAPSPPPGSRLRASAGRQTCRCRAGWAGRSRRRR